MKKKIKLLFLLLICSFGAAAMSNTKKQMPDEIYHASPIETDDYIQRITVISRHIRCAVWTPQHAPRPDKDHYAFNFPNNGWSWNNAKGCYEIFMQQGGFLDTSNLLFISTEAKYGRHNIQFHSFIDYLAALRND